MLKIPSTLKKLIWFLNWTFHNKTSEFWAAPKWDGWAITVLKLLSISNHQWLIRAEFLGTVCKAITLPPENPWPEEVAGNGAYLSIFSYRINYISLFCIHSTKQKEQTAADASPISNSGLLRELQHLATTRDLIPHSSVSYMLITCVFPASV